MVLADLMPEVPGEEAVLVVASGTARRDFLTLPVAFWKGPQGWQVGLTVYPDGQDGYLEGTGGFDGAALIDELSAGMAPLEPAGLMALRLGPGRLTMTP